MKTINFHPNYDLLIHDSKINSRFSGQRFKNKISVVSVVSLIVFLAIIVAFINVTDMEAITFEKDFLSSKVSQNPSPVIECSPACPENNPVRGKKPKPSNKACPEYFRWIHEDLKPWKSTGITKKMVESGKNVAHMRVVVVNGRVYIVKYKPAFQTRDVVTLWGILQLLRQYPGELPDLDFMFECGDKPKVPKLAFIRQNMTNVAPVFHYCRDDLSFDIVFPDWTFWGWPEVNLKPWEELSKELEEGNKRIKWMERKPYAYWKGNTKVSQSRQDLLRCNQGDWHAHIHQLNWTQEKKEGFNNTNIASQCAHRYKIYVEGIAWSVSKKYIMACDSVSLLINPHYQDFYTRNLLPTIHYWPISDKNKCKSIKYSVNWGNNNTNKAQEIGKAGSKFILEELQMKNVYDYMFHALLEYSKLLKYQPSIPEGAVEVCQETLICGKGAKKRFKLHSMVKGPSSISPCTLPPPYSPQELQTFLQRKSHLRKQVEAWEEESGIGEIGS